jgi:hypothetical protein
MAMTTSSREALGHLSKFMQAEENPQFLKWRCSPPERDGHDHLLQRGVASSLADAVDGALQLPRAAHGACGHQSCINQKLLNSCVLADAVDGAIQLLRAAHGARGH